MNMSMFFLAIEELGHRPEDVAFKCHKDRPAILVVTLKKTNAIVGLYDTVTRSWL